jgi:hypothetical protein
LFAFNGAIFILREGSAQAGRAPGAPFGCIDVTVMGVEPASF